MITSTKRLLHLETARGIASVIVVFHHFLLGFFPLLKAPLTQGGLRGTPLYMLVNGNGAVIFFFLLSGYVLTQRFYQQFSMQHLLASVLKRLPRLLLPAGLSMMIGAAILIYFSEAHKAAGQLTGSAWLANFANGRLPEGVVPNFPDALQDSLILFFSRGHAQYNSVLWTMMFEFYGSLLVFAFVAMSSLFLNQRLFSVIFVHVFFGALCVILLPLLFLPFVIGSLVAFLHCKRSTLFDLPPWTAILLGLIMIVGYSFENIYALIFASSATMILLLGVPSLEQRLIGPIGLFLGRLSFPLYLVHVLVILSVTSAIYTVLIGYGLPLWSVLVFCFAITWVVSFLVSLPFMTIERIWVSILNRWSQEWVRHLMK